MSFIKSIAETAGSSEAALRLILGQLLGYPIMLFYRNHISCQQTAVQHLYFIITGMLAGWFVIGGDICHSVYAILTTFLILTAAGGTLTSVIISFIFNFGYLLVGYYYTESEGYDICWTMPHCVLCLRLIGLSFDCYDGDRAKRRGKEALSKDQQKTALAEVPSVIEMFSHNFFIGGYFIGPQVPMSKYKQFVSQSYQDSLPGSPLGYGFKRLGLGISYLAFHVLGSMFLPSEWPASDDFINSCLVTKLMLLPFWCKFTLSKYLSAWLMSEGICVISGLSFNGVGPDGWIDWKGCANVKIGRLEGSTKFGHVIESFNINTNNWVAVYIYKRLKFMGSRTISQVVTLLFLAVWHGFHSGYYLVFFNEFLSIKVEREFLSIWTKSAKIVRWESDPKGAKIISFLGWCYVFFFLPHCLLPFVLLTYNKFLPSYLSMYGILYVIYFSWPLWKAFVRDFLWDENVKVKAKSEEVTEVAKEVVNEEMNEDEGKEVEKLVDATGEKAVESADSVENNDGNEEVHDHDKKNQ